MLAHAYRSVGVGKGAMLGIRRVGKIAYAPCPRGGDARSDFAHPTPLRSIRLVAGALDHLRPFLSFVDDELPECCGRRGKRHRAEIGEPGLELGIGESGVDLA